MGHGISTVRRRTVLTAAGAAAIGGTLATGTAHADMTVVVDPTADFGRWEGWGTSLAWWANVFGDRDDLADIWFTTRTVTYRGAPVPGLGMNIARYNLGGCGFNTVNGERMAVSPNIPAFKQIEGFWQDWNNPDPNSAAWNWAADAKQRAALVKATQRGAISELFANSPMWWMCLNHNPSGAANGGNNLQSWNYRQHAAHLAEVALRARTSWGVTFRTVDPFNEPAANWWRADGTQEGCHIDPAIQRTILAHLRTELNQRGLSGTMISASDETNYDVARATWASFDATTRGLVNQLNVHGYQGSGGRRDLLYNDARAAGKILWNSETGDNDGTGLSMARNILLDFRWLHPTAWVFWQVMDPTPAWALIHYDQGTLQSGAVQPKLFVLAQFSRHIRPGMRILGTVADNAVAAYDPAARRLVLVAANTGAAQTITFDLSRFGTVPSATIPRWTTVPSGSDRYTQRTDLRPTGKLLPVPFPAGSVQTVQLDGVG
ncbi:MAG TPA: glycoside hydrolase [Actinophytocola sp.]|uniref:glycoside hydrolase n=1 Tax=Actinophytocola sp. TaxID=1872138 RepID=UPI002DBA11DA|nr:glycoside hydrolase [Actinophytocola sp.]HEU5474650.1 glycoside hydrolase [Actinophytocola sp.]